MKSKPGSSAPKICDHEMVYFLCDGKNNFRACVKCNKSWPRPHPLLSEKEVLAVIDFGRYVAKHAAEKKAAQEKARRLLAREKQEELDLL